MLLEGEKLFQNLRKKTLISALLLLWPAQQESVVSCHSLPSISDFACIIFL